MKQLLLTLTLAMAGLTAHAQTEARFSAMESSSVYYYMGWDTAEEINSWSYSESSNAGTNFYWHLEENPPYPSQQPFSSIDPQSKYSLVIRYANEGTTQNEVCSSPILEIRPNSALEFYACFESVWLLVTQSANRDWKLFIYDTEADKVEMLLSGFMWAQENEFTGPSWQRFSIDLSQYAGKKCTFTFQYIGPDGEDLAIDGFKLVEMNDGSDAKVNVNEGNRVSFIDLSTGSPTSWQWSFPGGQPSESSEQNPVVTYQNAGTYDVTLTVNGPNGSSTTTRAQYVNATPQAPLAYIGIPDAPYYSPYAALFIPKGGSIAYEDQSRGKPTSWSWTFEGGQPSQSTDQNPTVTYPEEGVYGMTLDVSNSVGSSHDFMKNAIQVGGSQYVWNVAIEEQDLLGEINMGFYGYYGGTNWLGIEKYAEHFDRPAAPAEIDEVDVFFTSTAAVNPSTPITVTICKPDAQGMPGEVVASSTVTAGSLVNDSEYYLPTTFKLNPKVTVSDEFFVVIEGMTNNYDEATNQTDDMCIMALRRSNGSKSTAYHYLEDEDPTTYERLGTYQWFKNEDDPISLAIAPHLTYQEATAIGHTEADSAKPAITNRFDVSGQRVSAAHRGIQILKMSNGKTLKVVK